MAWCSIVYFKSCFNDGFSVDSAIRYAINYLLFYCRLILHTLLADTLYNVLMVSLNLSYIAVHS